MDQTRINRRRFVGIVVLTASLGALRRWRWITRPSDFAWFYVAGVRFNPIQVPPGINEAVRIQRREWRGRACYEVRTQNGERLGYVPRRWILEMANTAEHEWRICGVNPNGVPWKRYKILRVS
jgi:hypothetical protein